MSNANVEEWSAAAAASATEVVVQALGWESNGETSAGKAPEGNVCAAFVPVTADGNMLQIGVVTDRAGCEAISRALLCMGPDEAFGSDSDLADALGEIANMVAGGTKTRMNERYPGIALGLPLFVCGRVEQASAITSVRRMQLGAVVADIVVLLAPTSSPPRTLRRPV